MHDHVAANTESGERKKSYDKSDENEGFDSPSLDVVLEKARKRKLFLFPIKLQAFADKPVVKLGGGSAPYLTIGECALLLIAAKLGSYGFSVGFILGKGTLPFLRSSGMAPLIFVELWPVSLAIISDTVLNNLI